MNKQAASRIMQRPTTRRQNKISSKRQNAQVYLKIDVAIYIYIHTYIYIIMKQSPNLPSSIMGNILPCYVNLNTMTSYIELQP